MGFVIVIGPNNITRPIYSGHLDFVPHLPAAVKSHEASDRHSRYTLFFFCSILTLVCDPFAAFVEDKSYLPSGLDRSSVRIQNPTIVLNQMALKSVRYFVFFIRFFFFFFGGGGCSTMAWFVSMFLFGQSLWSLFAGCSARSMRRCWFRYREVCISVAFIFPAFFFKRIVLWVISFAFF